MYFDLSFALRSFLPMAADSNVYFLVVAAKATTLPPLKRKGRPRGRASITKVTQGSMRGEVFVTNTAPRLLAWVGWGDLLQLSMTADRTLTPPARESLSVKLWALETRLKRFKSVKLRHSESMCVKLRHSEPVMAAVLKRQPLP